MGSSLSSSGDQGGGRLTGIADCKQNSGVGPSTRRRIQSTLSPFRTSGAISATRVS
jgi:hypothetical protein